MKTILHQLRANRSTLGLLALGFTAGAIAMYYLHPNSSPFSRAETALIREVIDKLEQHGLDQAGGAERSHGFAAAAGLARYEDRWARLFGEKEGKRFNQVLREGTGDSGIDWQTKDGRSVASTIREGSPAAQTGIKVGDVLHSVVGVHRFSASSPLIALQLFPPGEMITLRVWRDDEKKFKDLTLTLERDTRSAVRLTSLTPSLAVIQVREFNQQLEEQLLELLTSSFAAVRPKTLVIDLRGQAGGTSDSARRLAAYFLKPGTVLSTTRCAKGESGKLIAQHSIPVSNRQKQTNFSPIASWLREVPLTIKVDEETFSIAEVFAAGMQEIGRARIEGVRTGGKGVGQTSFPLKNGQQLWVTNCEFLTPSGRQIHTIGVVPD